MHYTDLFRIFHLPFSEKIHLYSITNKLFTKIFKKSNTDLVIKYQKTLELCIKSISYEYESNKHRIGSL
ncbi:hypothetical protein KL86DYS1_20342 [uncultured Dysgonomonas sp.]|uniref:Uncharacterized protein n=1 Tax=uncultured Dysgonomonas sp. TaxID=206096 RepID=A0A212JNM4_9BACT|nr:hypothetical protein KL86DYS1_20342 [uncultured Dysgonomonas sp.]